MPITLRTDPRRADRGANFLRIVARLAPAVTLRQAKADLDSIAHRLRRVYPTENARKTGISLYPLHTEIVRDYRGMLWTLFASDGILLLVGCVNLANLLLVRAAGRQAEFAMRTSLGASRGRLIGQLLGEATSATPPSVARSGWRWRTSGLAVWRAWGPPDFPQMADVALDLNVLLFTVVASAVTAVVCGVAPAWFATRGTGTTRPDAIPNDRRDRTLKAVQRSFVAAQVAAATVLLDRLLLMRADTRHERFRGRLTPSQRSPSRYRCLRGHTDIAKRWYALRGAPQ